MKRMKKVAFMFPMARLAESRILRGVLDYAARQGTWIVDRNPEGFSASVESLVDWSGDGALTLLETPAQVRIAKTLKIPVVNLSGALRTSAVPRVMLDQEAVGRLAAEHFLERGLRNVAYFGQQGVAYSQQRQRGLVEGIRQAGGRCSVLEAPRSFGVSHPWHQWMRPLEEWLQGLQVPVGLLAVHDHRAAMVLDACLRLKLRVPRDVALLGVGNDEVACQFGQIPLSSVDRNYWREGYEAAALLDRWMRGERPCEQDVLIPPQGVVTRRSTEVEAIDDPHVAAAVRLIRERLTQPFGVDTLEKHLPVSRRYLYYHFRRCLHCTPYEYINRLRVERAKQLLADPRRLPLCRIAVACGFSDTRHLRLTFRRVTGGAIGEYRRLHGEAR